MSNVSVEIVTDRIHDLAAPIYRSGTAARLAGIPVATLRMWERRYRVVGPQTSARGHRRYAAGDVSRLALIKSLVDRGHPIGTVAHLPLETLREMHAGATGATVNEPRLTPPRAPRVAIVGEALCAQASAADAASMHVAAACADRSQAAAALRDVRADVLAIELPALRDDAVDLVETLAAQVGARRAIVAYRFATEAALRELRRRGHVVAHAPVGLAEMVALAVGGFEAGAAPLAAAPAPRFGERALVQLSQVTTKVRCECPKHVVDLLLSLGAFERYSNECENRSPADAELHRHLGRVAGNARLLFEEALIRVAQAEGIELPDGQRRETASPPARG